METSDRLSQSRVNRKTYRVKCLALFSSASTLDHHHHHTFLVISTNENVHASTHACKEKETSS